jgi:hypothetical protein
MSLSDKRTLSDHLTQILPNRDANVGNCEATRLADSVCIHLKHYFPILAKKSNPQSKKLREKFVRLILSTQDNKDFIYYKPSNDDTPNQSWNRPSAGYRQWRISYLMYEWDHVIPLNNLNKDGNCCRDVHALENLALMSGNCNQFVKCSLSIEMMLKILRGKNDNVLIDRITKVLDNRNKLFSSVEWANFKKEVYHNEINSLIDKVLLKN